MSSRRTIIVDGTEYRWLFASSAVFVWDPMRKQHRARIEDVTGIDLYDFQIGQERGRPSGAVTPLQVANWIRTHLQGKPPIRRVPLNLPSSTPDAIAEAPRLPFVAPYVGQREVYLVEGEVGQCRERRHWIEAIHLDPVAAKQHANGLNEWWDKIVSWNRLYQDLYAAERERCVISAQSHAFDDAMFEQHFFETEVVLADQRWRAPITSRHSSGIHPRYSASARALLAPLSDGMKQDG